MLAAPNTGLLLQRDKNPTGPQVFYVFNESKLLLYEINQKSEFYKIWEYGFLADKKISPKSLLYGDITGNGKNELIVIGYVFGKETEIYVFQTDNSLPIGAPSIYQINSLKKGARPIDAKLVPWDQDKDQEILIAFSSPERKIVLLDFSINNLSPIKETIATDFMTTTYGPVHVDVTSSPNNTGQELLLYTSTENSQKYTYNFKTKEEKTTTISPPSPTKIKLIRIKGEPLEIIINKSGKTYLADNTPVKMPLITKDIVEFNSGEIVQISPESINLLSYDKEKGFQSSQSQQISTKQKNYLYNTKNNMILVYDDQINNPQLFTINQNSIKREELKSANKKPINTDPTKPILIVEQDSLKMPPTIKEEVTLLDTVASIIEKSRISKTNLLDTLYINVEEKLEIEIITNQQNTIHGVETKNIPPGMSLDPKTLTFVWTPQKNNIGEHLFQYTIETESDPTLTVNTKDENKLTLERVSQKQTQDIKHLIIVNDFPILNIANKKDTINVTGNFSSSYTIVDSISKVPHKVKTIFPKNNTVLISNDAIYWEPKPVDFGENIFIFSVFDGLAKSLDTISVFVDTTKLILQDTLIAVLNEELIYQLPYDQDYKYSALNAPSNLRISQQGQVIWVPLATHVDENIIDLEIDMGTEIKQYSLNVYVNAPPVISFRPNAQEYITQGDSFSFVLQSFDFNVDPQLVWGLETINNKNQKYFSINKEGVFQVNTDSLLDNQDYIISLSDNMNTVKFFGTMYINSLPKIISVPPNYLALGDTLLYGVEVIDLNKEKPFSGKYLSTSQSLINYTLLEGPEGAQIDSLGLLFWVPSSSQLGSHNFEIEVADSLTIIPHTFSLFVNDKPNIISSDSLSIMAGDTLEHFFNATDLNGESDLIYSIKTTIDELIFSGKAGKLTWVPTEENIGLHDLEISVSDGFSQSLDNQKLKIFVYIPPSILNHPDSTAYANFEYKYIPKAHDMYGDSVSNKDVFIEFIKQDSTQQGSYNPETNTFLWIPSIQDLGRHRLEFLITDKYNTVNSRFYDINVLMSPCETQDTLYIDKTDTVYIKNKEPNSSKIPFFRTPGISY